MITEVFGDFNYILKQLDCPKKKKLSAVPLDVAPERCTNDAPRDFGAEVAFGAKFQIPVARREERNVGPRPFETDPFHPLG